MYAKYVAISMTKLWKVLLGTTWTIPGHVLSALLQKLSGISSIIDARLLRDMHGGKRVSDAGFPGFPDYRLVLFHAIAEIE